jgi:hypothetical protein
VRRSRDRQCSRRSLGALGNPLEIKRAWLWPGNVPRRRSLARRREVRRSLRSRPLRGAAAGVERAILRPLLRAKRLARLTATAPPTSARATPGSLTTLAFGSLRLCGLLSVRGARRHVVPRWLGCALLLDPRLLRTLFVARRLRLLLVARLPLRATLTLPTLGVLLVGPTTAL